MKYLLFGQEARRKYEEEQREITDEEDIEEEEVVKEDKDGKNSDDKIFYDVCKTENEVEKNEPK